MGVNGVIGWLRSSPYWIFLGLCVATATVKTGIAGALPFYPIAEAVDSFPRPTGGLDGLSLGMRGVARLVGAREESSYFLLSVAITGAAFVTLGLAARHSREDDRLKAVLLVLGPLGVVLLGNVGRHDALLILGATLTISLYKQWWGVLLGSFVMVMANPEQASVASLAMLCLAGTSCFRPFLRAAVLACSLSWVGTAGLFILSRQSSNSTSRADFLGELLADSLRNSLTNLPLLLYSALGVVWIIWIGLFRESSIRDRLLVVASVSIPLAVALTTLDQTRVAVCVGSLVILMLTLQTTTCSLALLRTLGCRQPGTMLALLAVAAPSVEVTYAGTPRAPFAWMARRLGII